MAEVGIEEELNVTQGSKRLPPPRTETPVSFAAEKPLPEGTTRRLETVRDCIAEHDLAEMGEKGSTEESIILK